jgi:hypothetical protein
MHTSLKSSCAPWKKWTETRLHLTIFTTAPRIDFLVSCQNHHMIIPTGDLLHWIAEEEVELHGF